MTTEWDSIENAPFPFAGDPYSKQNHNGAEWELLKQNLSIGSIISGKIYARVVFGVFYDAGLGFPVRMNITDFGVYKEGGMVLPMTIQP